ncbi:Myb-like dna-binding, partial [Globisporangium splendens]
MVELHQAKLVPTQFTVTKPGEHAWSSAEQRRFWEAIHRFPQGPWTAIAAYVGSKSTRQAMTHAQKLRQKLSRWKRRVRNGTESGDSSGCSSPRSELNEYDDDDDNLGDINEEDDMSNCVVKAEDMTAMQYGATFSPDDVTHHDNDAYLDDLLSDIEPVLENVVNFASSPKSEYAATDAMMHPSAFAPADMMHATESKPSLAEMNASSSSYFASYQSASWHVMDHEQQHDAVAAPHEYMAAPIDFRP